MVWYQQGIIRGVKSSIIKDMKIGEPSHRQYKQDGGECLMGYLVYEGQLSGKNRGFLLIELLIALAAVAVFSASVAFIQAQAWGWQREAQRYFQAVTLAAEVLEQAQRDSRMLHTVAKPEGMEVTTTIERWDSRVPFSLVTVCVSWKSGMRPAQVIITGGVVDRDAPQE